MPSCDSTEELVSELIKCILEAQGLLRVWRHSQKVEIYKLWLILFFYTHQNRKPGLYLFEIKWLKIILPNEVVAVKTLYMKIKVTFQPAMILEITGKEIVEKFPSKPPKSTVGLITKMEIWVKPCKMLNTWEVLNEARDIAPYIVTAGQCGADNFFLQYLSELLDAAWLTQRLIPKGLVGSVFSTVGLRLRVAALPGKPPQCAQVCTAHMTFCAVK